MQRRPGKVLNKFPAPSLNMKETNIKDSQFHNVLVHSLTNSIVSEVWETFLQELTEMPLFIPNSPQEIKHLRSNPDFPRKKCCGWSVGAWDWGYGLKFGVLAFQMVGFQSLDCNCNFFELCCRNTEESTIFVYNDGLKRPEDKWQACSKHRIEMSRI